MTDTLSTPEAILSPSNLRIVLQHTTGPHKGLMQIMGTSQQFGGESLPACTDVFDIQPHARKGVAGLVRVARRFALYREIDSPVDPTDFIDRSRQR